MTLATAFRTAATKAKNGVAWLLKSDDLVESYTKMGARLGIGAVSLTLAFMAVTGSGTQALGATTTDPGLTGTTTMSQVYNDAPPQKVLTVEGQSLKASGHYVYDGTLIIKGDVPAKAQLTVTNGKLEVTGNIGAGAKIDARLPVLSHMDTNIIGIPVMTTVGNSLIMTTTPLPMITATEDGLAHPADQGPAVKIHGTIASGAEVATNGGIEAGGWAADFSPKTGYGRTLQQLSATPALRTAAPAV